MYRWLFWLCVVLAIAPLAAIPWSDRPFILALQSSAFVGLARLCARRRGVGERA